MGCFEMRKSLDSENIFRMYLDTLKESSDGGIYDSYAVFQRYHAKLEKYAGVSHLARRYQAMIKEVVDLDPRVQKKLDFA